jgi:hypothetical protein
MGNQTSGEKAVEFAEKAAQIEQTLPSFKAYQSLTELSILTLA